MAPKRRGKTLTSNEATKMSKIKETNTKILQIERALDEGHCDSSVLALVHEIIKKPNNLSSALAIRLLQFCVKSKNEHLAQELLRHQTVYLKTPEGGQMLWEAVDMIDRSLALLLVRSGADLSFRSPEDNSTILHKVLTSFYNSRKEELVRLMLLHGADINACDIRGCTVLHSAISSHCCSYQLVEELLERGAFVTFGGDDHLDDISAACDFKPNLLPKLIEHQARDMETRNERGAIAIKKLMLSKCDGTLPTMKKILDLGIFIPKDCVYVCTVNYIILPSLDQNKNLLFDKIELLLEYGAYPSCPLYKLIESNSDELIRLILKYVSDVNTYNHGSNTILHHAMYQNFSSEIVLELLKCGADVDAVDGRGNTAIWILAREFPSSNILPILVQWGNPSVEITKKRAMTAMWALAGIEDQPSTRFQELLTIKELPIFEEKNEKGLTLFDYVVAKRRLGMVKMLLDYSDSEILTDSEANSEAYEKRAMTALQALVVLEDDKLTYFKRYLAIEELPIYRQRDAEGFTLLDRAVTGQRHDMVEILLNYSDNVKNEIYSAGSSSLLIASKLEHYSIVELLIKKGANIEARDELGRTPLIEASRYRRLKNVKLLVVFGADIEAIDNNGDTALTWACLDYFYFKSIGLLLRLGADVDAVGRYNHVPFFYIKKREDKSRIFTEHIAILIGRDITVHDENLVIINSDPRIQQYYTTCLDELVRMKSSTIYGNISLFSILTANSQKLLSLTKNVIVAEYLQGLKRSHYPIYYERIAIQFNTAERKRNIINDRIEVLDEISKGALPYLAVEMIAHYSCCDELIHVDVESDD